MISTEEVDMIWGLQLCNYSAMGALTFTVHDAILAFDEELQQMWKRPWTNLKSLYFFIRCLSLGSQIFSAVVSLQLASGNTDSSLRGCKVLATFQGATSQVLMMGVQIILILRVQALYHEKIYLRRLLSVLFLSEVAVMLVAFIIAMPEVQYGLHCVIISFPLKALIFLVPPILFEFLLFVLTMKKFYEAVRDGWGREPIIARFLRDGIWAFALPFTILIINTSCMLFLSGAMSSVAYSWLIAIPGFAGCRLILNMSHLLKTNRTSRSSYGGLLDTIISTYEDTTLDIDSYEQDCANTAPNSAQPSPYRM